MGLGNHCEALFFFLAFHRAVAAFLAIATRSLAERLSALALPPLSPPSLPKATAAGFLLGAVLDFPPVVCDTIEAAS
jgi:hypothetical protein